MRDQRTAPASCRSLATRRLLVVQRCRVEAVAVVEEDAHPHPRDVPQRVLPQRVLRHRRVVATTAMRQATLVTITGVGATTETETVVVAVVTRALEGGAETIAEGAVMIETGGAAAGVRGTAVVVAAQRGMTVSVDVVGAVRASRTAVSETPDAAAVVIVEGMSDVSDASRESVDARRAPTRRGHGGESIESTLRRTERAARIRRYR